MRRMVNLMVVAVTLGACQPQASVESPADVSGLPAWQEKEKELFDDIVDPASLGLALEGSMPASDPLLKKRAQQSEVVAQVVVTTVTIDTVGDDSTYRLVVAIQNPLATPKLSDTTLDLAIKPGTRSHPQAKALDTRMRGMRFVVFAKRYADAESGDAELHWHLAPDTPDVVAAVKEAVALGELAGH